MSESDSFISEVTEEVRRDRLFKTFKKYAWVLVLIVVAIVGGTAYNEWNKGATAKQARLTGDIMRSSLDTQSAAALTSLASDDIPAAVIAAFQLSTVLVNTDDVQGAVAALQPIADSKDISAVYTDLAWLKIVMISATTMNPDDRDGVLARLTLETAPYRLLAIEQRALQSIRDGNFDKALDDFAQILADETVSQGLRNRAQQLTVSLGGTLPTTGNG